MRRKLHPAKYFEQMSAALIRIEGIARLPTMQRDRSLSEEFVGVSEKEVLHNREILGQLEPTMADWRQDGCISYDMSFILNQFAGYQIAPLQIDAETFEPSVVYVHFGPNAQLNLEADESCHIEGMYFRPSYRDGQIGLELTFVCDEPARFAMSDHPYGKALRTASRVAIGFFPFDGAGSIAPRWIDGDPALLIDKSMDHACSAATIALSVIATCANRLDADAKREPPPTMTMH